MARSTTTAVAVCALVSSFVLAIAAGGPNDPRFQPDTLVVPQALNVATASLTDFVVPAPAAPLTIGSIDPVGCAPGITASPQSFTVPSGGGTETITIDCPAFATYGIARCRFEAKTAASTTVAATTVFCVRESTDMFTPDKSSLSFVAPVGGTSTQQTVMISAPGRRTRRPTSR